MGDLIGGLLDFGGNERTNQSNEKIARENREFQERMSSSAYQRSMTDMKKAGLNPMLAYMKGGASTPSGSTATMTNSIGKGISTALASARQKADLKLIKEQTGVSYAQGLKTMQEADFLRKQNIIAKPLVMEANAMAGLYGAGSKAVGADNDIGFNPNSALKGMSLIKSFFK